MFKLRVRPYYRIPQIIAALSGVLATYYVIAAQSAEPQASGVNIKELATTAMAVAGAIALVVGIGWGIINRKNYDKLKETIDDLEEVLESKDRRIEELRLTASESEARLTLRIVGFETTCRNFKVSNEAVVSQNLQMKAILKRLRLDGKWQGHEDDLHRTEA